MKGWVTIARRWADVLLHRERLARIARHGLTGVVLGMLAASAASGQTYPAKPVRVVVPYAAGGNIDVTARLVAQGLTEATGQSFFVDNRPGANGNLGLEQVARSAADGYTLAVVSAASMTVNPHLYRSMPFDTVKDFSPITLVASGPLMLVVNPALPVNSVPELAAYAKANPGKVNFGTQGNGTLGHLTTEVLKTRAGIDVMIVPYRGNATVLTGLLAGEVHALFDTLASATPHVERGRLRGLATTGARRSARLPNVPTVAESGLPDFSADAWSGLVGPAGIAPDIARRLQQDVARVLSRPEVRQKIGAQGNEPVGSTPEVLADTIRTELAKWGTVARNAGIRPE